MNEAFVLHDADGYRAYRHVGATHAQRIGPAWKSPRQAIDYAKRLDEGAGVSPLRPTTSEAAGYPPTEPLRGSPAAALVPRHGRG